MAAYFNNKLLRTLGETYSDEDEVLPEKRLLKKLVLSAVTDLLDPKVIGSGEDRITLKKRAKEWLFFEKKEPLRPFSFPWICQHLSDNGEDLRRQILQRIDLLGGERS